MNISKRIIIGILARDCEKTLVSNIERVEELRSYFDSSEVCIVENDSIDHTKEILQEWEKTSSSIHLDSFNDNKKASHEMASKGFSRIEKMVSYRNRLLANIRALAVADYLVFIDIDIVSFDVKGIIKAIQNAPDNWGGLFANGSLSVCLPNNRKESLGLQYDTYAYLSYSTFLQKAVNKQSDVSQLLTSKVMQYYINRNNYVNCISAFGGLGIYNVNNLSGEMTYELLRLNSELFICEHIPFNKKIVNLGAKNYICSHIKVDYGYIDVKGIKVYLMYYFPFTFNLIHLFLRLFR